MKRFIVPIVAVLFTLLFLFAAYGLTVSAQDATAEPTAEVTETPEQPPVVDVPSADTYISISTLVFGLVVAVLGGGTVGAIIIRFGTSKANLDAAEKLYLSWPPETQELIARLLDVVEDAVKLGRVVTDGRSNDDTPVLGKPRTPLN